MEEETGKDVELVSLLFVIAQIDVNVQKKRLLECMKQNDSL